MRPLQHPDPPTPSSAPAAMHVTAAPLAPSRDAPPLLPSSTPRPRRRSSSTAHSLVDLPCLLIVFGVLFSSLSVFSLHFMLSAPDVQPAARPLTLAPARAPGTASSNQRTTLTTQKVTDRTASRFFVRDWPLCVACPSSLPLPLCRPTLPARLTQTSGTCSHLGWNNMRYNIESSLLQASLLNRTLVIPSHLVGRACEHHYSVCAGTSPPSCG